MEIFFVKVFSWFFSRIRIPGSYRIACLLYPYRKTSLQKGVTLNKNYLQSKYNLSINLFSKDLIDHKILFTGAYEAPTNLVLEKNLQGGDVVLEAGANSGTETLLIARLIGNTGKIFAFEPVPHIVEKLKNNLALNVITNAVVMPLALGEKNQEISFFVYPPEHPNQGMGSKVLDHSGLQKITVPQITIDSLFETNTFERFDFLKMDVQGAELDILKGARKTLSHHRPKIFLEAADSLSDVKIIHDYFKSMDYEVFHILAGGKLEIIDPLNFKMGNWLAVPNNKS